MSCNFMPAISYPAIMGPLHFHLFHSQHPNWDPFQFIEKELTLQSHTLGILRLLRTTETLKNMRFAQFRKQTVLAGCLLPSFQLRPPRVVQAALRRIDRSRFMCLNVYSIQNECDKRSRPLFRFCVNFVHITVQLAAVFINRRIALFFAVGKSIDVYHVRRLSTGQWSPLSLSFFISEIRFIHATLC